MEDRTRNIEKQINVSMSNSDWLTIQNLATEGVRALEEKRDANATLDNFKRKRSEAHNALVSNSSIFKAAFGHRFSTM